MGNFQIPRNPGKTEHAQTVCTRLFSPRPCMRAWEQGYAHLYTSNQEMEQIPKVSTRHLSLFYTLLRNIDHLSNTLALT